MVCQDYRGPPNKTSQKGLQSQSFENGNQGQSRTSMV